MRALRFTDDALADLDAVNRWLKQSSAGRAAQRRLTAIWSAIERLQQYLCLSPSVEHPGVRELTCGGGYRVLYRVVPDTVRNDTAGDVQVLKIFGPGQDRSTV